MISFPSGQVNKLLVICDLQGILKGWQEVRCRYNLTKQMQIRSLSVLEHLKNNIVNLVWVTVLVTSFGLNYPSDASMVNLHQKAIALKTEKPAEKTKLDKGTAPKPVSNPEPVLDNLIVVTPLELVNKPQQYLNKNIKLTAKFYAFSNLALDYKPAYRSSKTHLSFLILRPDTHIPLSELKLAMMIPKEKDPENTLLATLKDDDQVELIGKVFSTALDDPWVEIFKIKKLNISSNEQANAKVKTQAIEKQK